MRFTTGEGAMPVPSIVEDIRAVQAMLPRAIDEGCLFANGGGYIQHTPATFAAFLAAVQGLFDKHAPSLAKMFSAQPRGFVGRYLDDGGSPLYSVYMRICMIDDSYREWGQPYYAIHPGTGKHVVWPNTEGGKV